MNARRKCRRFLSSRHGDENIGPPFLEGDGLAHVRSPHFIDLLGDDGSVVRLLLVAPDAMGREQAVLSHHVA